MTDSPSNSDAAESRYTPRVSWGVRLHPANIIVIQLSHTTYTVYVGSGVLDKVGMYCIECGIQNDVSDRAMVVHDRNLPNAIIERMRSRLDHYLYDSSFVAIDADEEQKSLATTEMIVTRLAELRYDRRELVIALGGGIIGDVAGFAAAIYRRGIPVVQCPTTLLAMVDASVGGKTGVNLRVGSSLKKNLLGSFHQPALVIADVDVLGSLPPRVFAAGLAECVKHSMLEDSIEPAPQTQSMRDEPANGTRLAPWMQANLDKIIARDPETLIELVCRNIVIKAAVVVTDEREEADETTTNGGRALLNLGHTFGHAIETLPNLSPDGNPANAPLNHGEAVALGLVAAANCSIRLGLTPTTTLDRLVRTLEAIGLPTRVAGLPPSERVLEIMLHDKKVLGNRLRLVLPHGDAGNQAKIVSDPPREAVLAAIDAIRAP